MLVVFFSFNSIWIELYVSGSTVLCGTEAVAPHAVLLAFLSTFFVNLFIKAFSLPFPWPSRAPPCAKAGSETNASSPEAFGGSSYGPLDAHFLDE